MLWVSDVTGRVASISQQFHSPAQSPADSPDDAADDVCFNDVHGDDVDALRELLSAHPGKDVAGRFRVRRSDRVSYVWVSFVGTPAVSPDDGSFCGYIGSATVARDVPDRPPITKTPANDAWRAHLDAIKGYLTFARALAASARDGRISKVIDLALVIVGDRMTVDVD